MLKFRDGPGVRDPHGGLRIKDFRSDKIPENLRFVFIIVFCKISPSGNHENTTFQQFLETEGPRDRACGKERNNLFRIALTRALYGQMAPQLCLFTFQVRDPRWDPWWDPRWDPQAGARELLVFRAAKS